MKIDDAWSRQRNLAPQAVNRAPEDSDRAIHQLPGWATTSLILSCERIGAFACALSPGVGADLAKRFGLCDWRLRYVWLGVDFLKAGGVIDFQRIWSQQATSPQMRSMI